MLTTDLVRIRATRDGLKCTFVDPTQARMVEKAAAILHAFAENVGNARSAVDEALVEVEGDGIDHKLIRGLAKLCFDRSEFDTAAVLPPFELRKAVFGLAARTGPVLVGDAAVAEEGVEPTRTAAALYAALGRELGTTGAALERALYADLPSEQLLQSVDVPGPEWLLHRYNVALVQAALLRARSIRLTLPSPKAGELRALCRAVKFHQLLAEATCPEDAPGSVVLTIDGPASLLSLNTRYGLALAKFFPAVPLLTTPWTMSATVAWGARAAKLDVDDALGLVSHYRAQGAWQSREALWFYERWRETVPTWSIVEGGAPVDQGGEALVVPDFTMEREGFTVQLEILGFWRRGSVERRLALLKRHGPKHLLIAASRKLLQGEVGDADELPEGVVVFGENVPVKAVLAAAEEMRERAAKSPRRPRK